MNARECIAKQETGAKQTALCERTLGIEKAFGVKRYTLMRMWSAYEIAQTRKREKLIRVRRVLAGGVRCGRECCGIPGHRSETGGTLFLYQTLAR